MSELADTLIAARRGAAQIQFQPRFAALDESQAYHLQAEIAAALRTRPVGWKVGQSPEGVPFAAPILDCDCFDSGASIDPPAGEPAKIEIELALRLGRDLPARAALYTREDILDATHAAFIGIELVRARYRAEPAAAFTALLADNYNNWGYVIGESQSAFRTLDLCALRARGWIDGELFEDRTGSHPSGDPLAPALAWANRQGDRLGGLRAGQFITTGTLTTPAAVARALRFEARIDDIGAVAAQFAPSA